MIYQITFFIYNVQMSWFLIIFSGWSNLSRGALQIFSLVRNPSFLLVHAYLLSPLDYNNIIDLTMFLVWLKGVKTVCILTLGSLRTLRDNTKKISQSQSSSQGQQYFSQGLMQFFKNTMFSIQFTESKIFLSSTDTFYQNTGLSFNGMDK